MKRFLEAYGKDMEFCQIQLNYLDWDFQDAKRKVELLDQWNIPVWVMEPLRGGKLASLAPEDEDKLKALRPDEGIPAWAFRYLQSIPSVVVTLSGMSNMEQMKENIATFETDKPLNETELETLHAIAQGMVKKIVLPWTFPTCSLCTTSTALPRAALSRPWPCPPSPPTSSPAPALAAAAARLYVPRTLRFPRPWRTSPLSWVADVSLLG